MARHRRNGRFSRAAAANDSEEIRRAQLSLEVDIVKETIENICLRNYMTKDETVAFLFIQQHREPSFTEIVWNELESQNPQFFIEYYARVELKHQIARFNQLLILQLDAMMAAGLGPAPNGDPMRSTAANGSNPNSLQRGGTLPQSTANDSVHAPIPDALRVSAVMVTSNGVNQMMDVAIDRNGIVHATRMREPTFIFARDAVAVRASAMSGSIGMQPHPMHFPSLNRFRPPGMSPLSRMQQPVNAAAVHNSTSFHAPGMNIPGSSGYSSGMYRQPANPSIYSSGMNIAGMYRQPANPSIYSSGMNIAGMYRQPANPWIYNSGQFGVSMPGRGPLIPNRPIFPISTQTMPNTMDVDPILDVSSNDIQQAAPQDHPMDPHGHHQNPR